MIKNERQYKITKSQLKKFVDTLDLLKKENTSDIHPLFVKAQLDSIKSQIQTFEREIAEYEKIKDGQVSCFSIDISDFSTGIINSRIASGLNHKEFGGILGVTAQQIQKYESENYQSTSLSRIQEIISILGINVKTTFNLAKRGEDEKKPKFSIPEGMNLEGIRQKVIQHKSPLVLIN
jgi:transcriptional regulator with XRE-family HTH domain